MLIIIEGINGAGKSVLIEGLSKTLYKNGITPYISTPSRCGIDTDVLNLTASQYANIFFQSMEKQMLEYITPLVNNNKIVIMDRFTESTVAYQGVLGGENIESLKKRSNNIMSNISNIITIVVDCNEKKAYNRVIRRNKKMQYYKKLTIDDFRKLRAYYLSLIDNNKYILFDTKNYQHSMRIITALIIYKIINFI